ncbi:MAG: hypothetical protein WAW63_01060 [Candidatus Saccharimonadales bacterium]
MSDQKSSLGEVPVTTLLAEVLRRPGELVEQDGSLSDPAFKLADTLGIRVCVDGVPARRNPDSEEIELMTIRRNTGPYKGKLCLVGGGVGRVDVGGIFVPESFEEALRRHFQRDVGLHIELFTSWTTPQYLAQDMRPVEGNIRPDFTPNPAARHLVAARFLVRIVSDNDTEAVFGSTRWGGQEASGIEWLTEQSMPSDEDFGYGHGETLRAMFLAAKPLVP